MPRHFVPLASCFVIALSTLIYTSCVKKVGVPPKVVVPTNICDSATYSLKIKQLIVSSCALSGCHEAEFAYGDFNKYDELKLKVDAGSFKTRVFDSPAKPMPPPESGGMLPADKLALIRCWLDKGAPNN